MGDKIDKYLKLFLHGSQKSSQWTNYRSGEQQTCPSGGLPIWRELPLDNKLPYLTIPPGNVYLSRGLAGQQLWPTKMAHDLRLYDAYGHILNLPYEALHDPYLASHLKKKSVVSDLRHAKKLHSDGAALCSLKDLNKYREFKRMMNLDEIHHGIKVETEAQEEKRRLEQLEEIIKKRKEKWDLKQRLEEMGEERNERKARRLMEKQERWLRSQRMLLQKRRKLQLTKLVNQKARKMKLEFQFENVKKRLESIAAEEKTKVLLHVRKMRLRDEKQAKRKEIELREAECKKKEEIKKRWTQKVSEMTRMETVKQKVLGDILSTNLMNVERRKERALQTKKRQDALLEAIKWKRTLNKAEAQKKLEHPRMRESIMSTWLPEVKPEDKETVKYYIDKSLESILSYTGKFKSEGSDRYLSIMSCKACVDKHKSTPVPVSSVIDYILEETIKNWARKILLSLMVETRESVFEYGSKLLEHLRASRTKKTSKMIESKKLASETIIIKRPQVFMRVSSKYPAKNQQKASVMKKYLKELPVENKRMSNQSYLRDTNVLIEQSSTQQPKEYVINHKTKLQAKRHLAFKTDANSNENKDEGEEENREQQARKNSMLTTTALPKAISTIPYADKKHNSESKEAHIKSGRDENSIRTSPTQTTKVIQNSSFNKEQNINNDRVSIIDIYLNRKETKSTYSETPKTSPSLKNMEENPALDLKTGKSAYSSSSPGIKNQQTKSHNLGFKPEICLVEQEYGIKNINNGMTKSTPSAAKKPQTRAMKMETNEIKQNLGNGFKEKEKIEPNINTEVEPKKTAATRINRRQSSECQESVVRFGEVEEFRVLTFPEQLFDVRSRLLTPMPSYENLARMAWNDAQLHPPEVIGETQDFQEKDDLEKTCQKIIRKIINPAKKLISECVEPTSRLKTIKKLATIQDYHIEDLALKLASEILEKENVDSIAAKICVSECCVAHEVAGGIARSAVAQLLHPPEFNRKESDYVTCYRLLYVGPKNSKIKKCLLT